MKKFITDFKVIENISLSQRIFLLKLTPADGSKIAETHPGQFAELRIDHEPKVFLRRPISINYIDEKTNQLWLLIQKAGNGTNLLAESKVGDIINIVYPLGNGFTIDGKGYYLLIGGGVGVAPLLQLGKTLKDNGNEVSFLLGGRTATDIVQVQEFCAIGTVFITTEDGTQIEGLDCQKGFVTQHSCLKSGVFDFIRVCGPAPMMKSVAKTISGWTENATAHYCEVSLENKMACGIGVCLCCVENTKDGHKCVCTDGPVFDIKELNW